MNEWTAFVVTLMLAFVWIKAIEFFVHKKWVSGKLSRKIIHIGTGPLFVLCWLLFPATGYSNLLAAVIPLLITLQFFLVGSGFIKDPQLIESMSRTGNRREILKGPLYYGIVFVLITVMIWYHHPAGIIALMVMCGGDGMADLFGSRIKSNHFLWAKGKTVGGSIAMFVGAFLFSFIMLMIYQYVGIFDFLFYKLLRSLLIISLSSSIVESISRGNMDNITVPVSALILGYLLF